MSAPLDELYFRWLYSQVASVRARNSTRTYWSLLRLLYTKEFIWLIPNDDNRVADGRDLRHVFIEEKNVKNVDEAWMTLGCSFLEMLIGLSQRCAFEADGKDYVWFWHMMDNLNLGEFSDAHLVTRKQERYVNDVLDSVIWRSYRSDGHGGLFPLAHADKNQRDVELWYQLSCYLLEGHGV